MVKNYYLISDAAKLVQVESHVLRYWEEELKLPIKRNELGHRYYTIQDVERFQEIKEMKEQGLQLKAIRMILKDGKLSVEKSVNHTEKDANYTEKSVSRAERNEKETSVVERTGETALETENKAEKAKRLQWLLQQMIAETIKEVNGELGKDIKESILKELDYQFRLQDEKEEERAQERLTREDEHYHKIDELLRNKSKRKRHSFF